MLIYSVLLGLLPLTWISVIWDQIIDPEFDLEHIEQPESRVIKLFYKASAVINTNVAIRNICFVVIGIMTSLSAVLDLIIWTPCLLENPRVRKIMISFYLHFIFFLQNYTYRCALAIMVFFTFIKIPHLFKSILAGTSLLFYFLIIFGFIGKQEELRNPRTFFAVIG